MLVTDDALLINDIGLRCTKHTEINPQPTIRIHHTEHIRIVQLFQPLLRGWHIVFVIDTKDGDTLLCKRDQKTVLGVTGGAPGSPDVQQADLAFEYFLIHQTVSVFQRRQMECWYRLDRKSVV